MIDEWKRLMEEVKAARISEQERSWNLGQARGVEWAETSATAEELAGLAEFHDEIDEQGFDLVDYFDIDLPNRLDHAIAVFRAIGRARYEDDAFVEPDARDFFGSDEAGDPAFLSGWYDAAMEVWSRREQ